MRAAQLLSLKSLAFLLLLCFALTAEETIHLLRSHPNEIDWSRTISHHPGCTPLEATGRIVRCPVHGYGDMNFLCSADGCVGKQPYTGLSITPAEKQLLKMLFLK
jgi:hypothetical protein